MSRVPLSVSDEIVATFVRELTQVASAVVTTDRRVALSPELLLDVMSHGARVRQMGARIGMERALGKPV